MAPILPDSEYKKQAARLEALMAEGLSLRDASEQVAAEWAAKIQPDPKRATVGQARHGLLQRLFGGSDET